MSKYLFLLGLLTCIASTLVMAQQFQIHYTDTVFSGPFTGHVILYLSQHKPEPRKELYTPCYGIVVTAVKPGEDVEFAGNAIFYPKPLSQLPRGEYYVQAVWDRNLGGRSIGHSPGNLYSRPQQITLTDDTTTLFRITCDQLVREPVFVETMYTKELIAPSALLTAFHHKPVTVNGAVILPVEYYSQPARHFPVMIIVAGYGLDYHHYSSTSSQDTLPGKPVDTMTVIRVFLDGNCPLGHSVYANSDNNGPWGDALTREFLPLLKERFRCDGAFLIKGHSSGGWTSLYLQTHYPTLFAGCTASAPDYADFRSFNGRDLYQKAANPSADSSLPHAPAGHMEDVLYRGEQSMSFAAVFSPRGPDGMPMYLYDRKTGKIDTAVFNHWKQYDLSLYLRSNWFRLKTDLSGKIRVSVGSQDTYHLNFAVEKMEEMSKSIGADIVFAYYPGDHYSVATPDYKKAEDLWLEEKYREWQHRR